MKLYLIPAYKEKVRNQGYSRIIKAAETAGYAVEILNLQIQNRLFQDVVNEGVVVVSRGKSKQQAILGFSTGALLAYQISTKIEFNKAFFCSLSPLLEDDIPKSATLFINYFSKETVVDLKKQTYGKSLAKETFFFAGNREGRKLIKRTKVLAEKCNGNLTFISDNDHELDVSYTRELALKL